MNPLRAIDVSYCQQNIDFKAVKRNGVSAVLIRNGYLGKTDTQWDNHVSKALKSGLDIGSYTYLISENPEQSRKEAAETIKRLEKYKGKFTYPIFSDMEDEKYMTSRFDKSSRTKILLAFLEVIEKSGYYPAIYTNPSWLESYLDKTKLLNKYDIWLAAYTHDPNKPTRFDYNQTIWQWGLDYIKGVGEVDGDLVYVDYPTKIRTMGKNFLEQYQSVVLDFDVAVRSQPSPSSKKLGILSAGTKCVVVKKSDIYDEASNYTYVKLAGDKSQWIVKSAIHGGNR